MRSYKKKYRKLILVRISLIFEISHMIIYMKENMLHKIVFLKAQILVQKEINILFNKNRKLKN